jgi:predicted small lipoprotein YifL
VKPLALLLPCDRNANQIESRSMNWWYRLIVLVGIAVALTACGVRGDLDPPPGATPKKDEPIILDKLI